MQHENNPPSYQTAMATSDSTSLTCIRSLCLVIMGLCVMQISVAAVGFMLPCSFGTYVNSFRQYGNSFWIAGPTLIYVGLVFWTLHKHSLNKNRIANMKIAAFLCTLGTIAGFVIAGLNIRMLVIFGNMTQIHDAVFHCDFHRISGKQFHDIAILTTTLHVVTNAVYFGFYVWVMKLNNEGLGAPQTTTQAPFTVSTPACSPPDYEDCLRLKKKVAEAKQPV